MLKRLLILALAFGAAPAFAAGTLPGISMSQQLDTDGTPLNGGKLYLIQAGTTSTPQNCYQDSGLTLAWPNPITLDSAGRIPQLFCADGSIKIRLTNSAGVTKLVADGLLVVGPSGGGGGGGSIDPTTVIATGDLKVRWGTGVISGFVRANGRTIGSATSGATERANSDCQSLFEYLWNTDVNLAVSGGRGASSNADWAANKTIALPDARGYTLAGLADMGNTTSSIFAGAAFSFGNSTVLGSKIGAAQHTLNTLNLPPYTPSGTIGGGQFVGSFWAGTQNLYGGGPNGGPQSLQNISILGSNFTFVGNAQGGISAPFDSMSPYLLLTIYLKL